MKVIWLIANTIVAAWLSPHILYNPVFGVAMRKWGFSAGRIAALVLAVVFAAFHIAIAIAVCLLASVGAAVIVTSLLGFGWALVCYFLLQRFAGPFSRTMRVNEHPALYPLAAFGGFVSSTLAIVFLADWRCGFVPIVVWLLLGFFCAEIAIRREARRFNEPDRSNNRRLAIFSINKHQSPGDYTAENRYPFFMSALTNVAFIALRLYYRIRNRW